MKSVQHDGEIFVLLLIVKPDFRSIDREANATLKIARLNTYRTTAIAETLYHRRCTVTGN